MKRQNAALEDMIAVIGEKEEEIRELRNIYGESKVYDRVPFKETSNIV
jgi:hypothetical protein